MHTMPAQTPVPSPSVLRRPGDAGSCCRAGARAPGLCSPAAPRAQQAQRAALRSGGRAQAREWCEKKSVCAGTCVCIYAPVPHTGPVLGSADAPDGCGGEGGRWRAGRPKGSLRVHRTAVEARRPRGPCVCTGPRAVEARRPRGPCVCTGPRAVEARRPRGHRKSRWPRAVEARRLKGPCVCSGPRAVEVRRPVRPRGAPHARPVHGSEDAPGSGWWRRV
jgi:hypothetical protein